MTDLVSIQTHGKIDCFLRAVVSPIGRIGERWDPVVFQVHLEPRVSKGSHPGPWLEASQGVFRQMDDAQLCEIWKVCEHARLDGWDSVVGKIQNLQIDESVEDTILKRNKEVFPAF